MEPVREVVWRGNVEEGFVGPDAVEDEGAVAAEFLGVKD